MVVEGGLTVKFGERVDAVVDQRVELPPIIFLDIGAVAVDGVFFCQTGSFLAAAAFLLLVFLLGIGVAVCLQLTGYRGCLGGVNVIFHSDICLAYLVEELGDGRTLAVEFPDGCLGFLYICGYLHVKRVGHALSAYAFKQGFSGLDAAGVRYQVFFVGLGSEPGECLNILRLEDGQCSVVVVCHD